MFCKNCGKEIDDNATVCVHCGVATGKGQQQQVVVSAPKSNGFAIAGLILAFCWFAALIGLILSIVGLQKSKLPEYNGNGKGVAIAGIVISCIMLAISIGVMSCVGVACGAALDSANAVLLPLV